MSISEKVEIAIITIFGLGLLLMKSVLPNEVSIGRLLLTASALLLFQSLVRDIWILSSRVSKKQVTREKAQCMCIESTLGIVGVFAGALILGSGFDHPVTIIHWVWSILLVFVLALGFSIKDYVFEWNPWRIRREKDHMNIIFSWKS